ALIVFPYEDDYSFGVLQSGIHWVWFVNRCSTLTGRYRYTSNTVFDSFAWPQAPTLKAVTKVADAAIELRALRRELKQQHGRSFRELYRTLELPGTSPLKDAHEKLDRAVRDAYGMKKSDDPLAFLLDLNQAVANREDAGEAVVAPGLPPVVKDKSKLVTDDCIHVPGNISCTAVA
ncbi:MAG: class I SAM-dependent DNA methyltransferase, partial [Planctomycetes bacterium]|nr:class I SAM-dependent DNA methyltransferase [Planctomycetota bacterium]